ncbi:MAG: type II toxin-antitoxin system PemK/MazF family toxin [Alphaproteobacteria bacterium]|nr:type II toxin-antitoxin system PemK/MazF family toxin [Alphaproteobacteria bacterium]
MPLPRPVPGLVIHYSYLWLEEHRRGREEGIKNRPCAIILTTQNDDSDEIVTVLPITHAPPNDLAKAMEIPLATKRRLGLDSERSWVVLSEANRFAWPGPDLRPTMSGDASSIAYGLLPEKLFGQMRERFVALVKRAGARAVDRTD